MMTVSSKSSIHLKQVHDRLVFGSSLLKLAAGQRGVQVII